MANITNRPLSVVANNATRAYGQANPVFSGTLTGVQGGDNITASYASDATTGSLPGAYAIVPTLNDPDTKLGNYAVTVSNGVLTIVDLPRLLSISEAPEGTFILQWQVYAGRTYRFEYKTNILDAAWTNLVLDQTAASSSLTITNNADANRQRIYRALDVTP